MATIAPISAPVKPTPRPADPWADPPAYAVPRAALVFGARVRHRVLPGVWKVVRAADRRDATSRFAFRVREEHADGSLVGPVLSWTLDAVAELVTADEPVSPGGLDVSLTLTINGVSYDVRPSAAIGLVTRAFRLARADAGGRVHDVEETGPGLASCSCGDYVHRRAGLDVGIGCKHLRALRMTGLLEFAPCAGTARPRPEEGHHVRDIGAGDALDPRTFDPHLDAEEDDAPGSWDDATSWTTTEDDDDGEDRWATTREPEPAPARARAKAKAKAKGTRSTAREAPAPSPLAAEIAGRIAGLRAEGTPLGELMADHLVGLLAEVEATDATSVEAFLDRRACLTSPG